MPLKDTLRRRLTAGDRFGYACRCDDITGVRTAERCGGPVAGDRNLVPIVIQLALAALVIKQFQLESRTFYNVFLLAAVAFPIHALLPLKYRMAFFTAVSFAGIGMVFGLRDGAMLVAAGLLLIGACHLPVSFAIRIAVVLALGVVLALSRAGVGPSVLAPGVWPILGSMFMFRLAVYLHALKHDGTPSDRRAHARRTSSCCPTSCFPLFPVVDYKTFGRTYYDDDALAHLPDGRGVDVARRRAAARCTASSTCT